MCRGKVVLGRGSPCFEETQVVSPVGGLWVTGGSGPAHCDTVGARTAASGTQRHVLELRAGKRLSSGSQRSVHLCLPPRAAGVPGPGARGSAAGVVSTQHSASEVPNVLVVSPACKSETKMLVPSSCTPTTQ